MHVQSVTVACYGEVPPDVLLIGGVCREEVVTPGWPDMVVPFPMDLPTTSTAVASTTSVGPPMLVEPVNAPSSPLPTVTTTSIPPRTLLPGQFFNGCSPLPFYDKYRATRFPIRELLTVDRVGWLVSHSSPMTGKFSHLPMRRCGHTRP